MAVALGYQEVPLGGVKLFYPKPLTDNFLLRCSVK